MSNTNLSQHVVFINISMYVYNNCGYRVEVHKFQACGKWEKIKGRDEGNDINKTRINVQQSQKIN